MFSVDSKQGFMHLRIILYIITFIGCSHAVHYNQLGVVRTHWAISRFSVQIGFLELATMEHLDKGEIIDGLRCELVNAVRVRMTF